MKYQSHKNFLRKGKAKKVITILKVYSAINTEVTETLGV